QTGQACFIGEALEKLHRVHRRHSRYMDMDMDMDIWIIVYMDFRILTAECGLGKGRKEREKWEGKREKQPGASNQFLAPGLCVGVRRSLYSRLTPTYKAGFCRVDKLAHPPN